MSSTAINSFGEALATTAIATAKNVPPWLLAEQRIAPWFTLSLGLVYLSFAKHWLPFLPDAGVAKAVDTAIDGCFFDFVEHTNFEIRVADVIVDSSEQAFYCDWAGSSFQEFHREHTDTHTLLTVLFASRCNQYAGDLRAGIINAVEKKPRVLSPVLFAYKRFNQHMWAIPCDVRSSNLEDGLKYLFPVDSLLMDGLEATQRVFTERMSTLPLSNDPKDA